MESFFKINFEKAYGKINWDFLQLTLRLREFDPVGPSGGGVTQEPSPGKAKVPHPSSLKGA